MTQWNDGSQQHNQRGKSPRKRHVVSFADPGQLRFLESLVVEDVDEGSRERGARHILYPDKSKLSDRNGDPPVDVL